MLRKPMSGTDLTPHWNEGPRSKEDTSNGERWKKIGIYAVISVISFLCGVVFLVLIIWKAYLLARLGLTGNLFYIVLLPMGLAAAGFLFGVVRSYARYSGKQLGGMLEMGGPIVAFLVVVILGFVLVPAAQEPTAKDVRMRYSVEGQSFLSSASFDELPTFFPPRATDRFPIPVRLAGENVTLQQLAERLSEALLQAGYGGKCSYYWLDDQHGPGFAIVTQIEHIQPDGKPVLDQRWGFDLPHYGQLTLGSLLRAITHADPGRYRLIALAASKRPLVEKDMPMTTDQVVILNKGPRWLGDSPWKTVVATVDFHLVAYVYEFERPSRSDAPVLLTETDSHLTAEQHLRSTGLYDDIERDIPEFVGQ